MRLKDIRVKGENNRGIKASQNRPLALWKELSVNYKKCMDLLGKFYNDDQEKPRITKEELKLFLDNPNFFHEEQDIFSMAMLYCNGDIRLFEEEADLWHYHEYEPEADVCSFSDLELLLDFIEIRRLKSA